MVLQCGEGAEEGIWKGEAAVRAAERSGPDTVRGGAQHIGRCGCVGGDCRRVEQLQCVGEKPHVKEVLHPPLQRVPLRLGGHQQHVQHPHPPH